MIARGLAGRPGRPWPVVRELREQVYRGDGALTQPVLDGGAERETQARFGAERVATEECQQECRREQERQGKFVAAAARDAPAPAAAYRPR